MKDQNSKNKISKEEYNKICDLYLNTEYKLYEIAELYSVNQNSIIKILKKLNIPKRQDSIGRGYSLKSWIEKASQIHNNFYNYDKVIYKNSKSKVCVTCPHHGDFFVEANSHIKGMKCAKCTGRDKYTTESILKIFKDTHNNFYSYPEFTYKSIKQKIKIICPIHDEFIQKIRNHMTGVGCQKCGIVKANNNKRYTTEEYIELCKKEHGDKYDYSETVYLGLEFKIKIKCPIHGMWETLPNYHRNGSKCPSCRKIGSSDLEKEWLDYCNIPNDSKNRQVCFNFDNKTFYVDGFDQSTNTIYEFYGDYWHGNLNIFNPNEINKVKGKTFQELYEDTIERENFFKNKGFKIISIWENDWEEIKRASLNGKPSSD